MWLVLITSIIVFIMDLVVAILLTTAFSDNLSKVDTFVDEQSVQSFWLTTTAFALSWASVLLLIFMMLFVSTFLAKNRTAKAVMFGFLILFNIGIIACAAAAYALYKELAPSSPDVTDEAFAFTTNYNALVLASCIIAGVTFIIIIIATALAMRTSFGKTSSGSKTESVTKFRVTERVSVE